MEQVSWYGHLLPEGWSTAGGKSSCYQHMVETTKCKLLCTLEPAVPNHTGPEHSVDRHRQCQDAGLWSALMHRLNGHICHRIAKRALNHLDGQNRNKSRQHNEDSAGSIFQHKKPRILSEKEQNLKSPLCLALILLMPSGPICFALLGSLPSDADREERSHSVGACTQTTPCITFRCIQIQLAEHVNNNYSISMNSPIFFFVIHFI